MKQLFFLVSVISCTLVLVTGNLVIGNDFVPGGFFFDDFEDGNSRDSNPARWERGTWNALDDEVMGGDLFILGASGSSLLGPRTPDHSAWLTYEDAIMRTQVRITSPSEERSSVGLWSRSLGPAVYLGFIRTSGEILIQESFNDGSVDVLQLLQTDLDPVADDILLEMRHVGSQISLTAWAEGQPKPAAPQISITDSTLPNGTFGPFYWTNGTLGDAAFRWIEVAPIPEPSSLALVAVAVCLLPHHWVNGFSHRSCRKRAKSMSQEASVAPRPIAIAAR